MDTYVTDEFSGDKIFMYNELLAFHSFTDTSTHCINNNNYNIITTNNNSNSNSNRNNILHHHSSSNVHQRVIERSSNNFNNNNNKEAEHEKERSYRHMINERIRRENHKQSYFALHSMLPLGTKNDKNSIIRTAAKNIQQLEHCREKLNQRKDELEMVMASHNNNNNNNNIERTKISVRVANPVLCGIDLMVEVLNCLKNFGLKSKNIHSVYALDEFSAELEIQIKIEPAVIEEAIQQTLYEAELKFLFNS